LNPSYRPLENLPLAEKVKAMRDPELRARIISEEPDDPNPFFKWLIDASNMLFILGDPPNYNPRTGEGLAAIADRGGRPLREAIYDSLLMRDGREIRYRPMGGTSGERFHGPVEALVSDPTAIIALGDGGAHYSMICDAAYTT